MPFIELSQGLRAEVDEADFALVSVYKWHATRGKWGIYANSTQTRVMMHRFLLNPKKDEIVHHKDRDGLNNKRENLLVTTNAINSRLSAQPKNRTNKYRGVYKDKHGKFQVRIKHNYKMIYVGYFFSEIKAALAYNKAALELFGEGNFFPNTVEEKPLTELDLSLLPEEYL